MKRVLFILSFVAICGVSSSFAGITAAQVKSNITIVTEKENSSVAAKDEKKDKKSESKGCCAKKAKECPKAEKKCCAESKKECPKAKKDCKK